MHHAGVSFLQPCGKLPLPAGAQQPPAAGQDVEPGPRGIPSLCPVPLSRAGAGSTAPVLGHVPALRHGQHCRTAALKKPIACPAALLCSFPQQKGSDFNKTSQKMQGKGQGTFTGGTQSTRESLGSTAQFIKLLSGAPRTYSVYGAEGRGLKYLADLCDLGLQVHHVESQTMFELPSVTINIGDEGLEKPGGESSPSPSALLGAAFPALGGSSTSPHSSQCCFPAGVRGIIPPNKGIKPPDGGIKPPDGGRRGQPRLGAAEGLCLEPGREPRLGVQPQRAQRKGRVHAQDYLCHIFWCI